MNGSRSEARAPDGVNAESQGVDPPLDATIRRCRVCGEGGMIRDRKDPLLVAVRTGRVTGDVYRDGSTTEITPPYSGLRCAASPDPAQTRSASSVSDPAVKVTR